MKIWMLIIIACLELLSNAARASDPNAPKQATKIEVFSDQQFNKFNDHGLVKNIRQELINDKSLSRSSKYIQIIVVGKEITLKGPVPSNDEQEKIIGIAKKNSEGRKIRNQLEVIRE